MTTWAYNRVVGARAVVHMAQFNGKQEGRPRKANLTCAAPATVSGQIRKDFASITATECLEQALGKAMGVAPPARIPANKVVVRPRITERPCAVGEDGEGFVDGLNLYEKWYLCRALGCVFCRPVFGFFLCAFTNFN